MGEASDSDYEAVEAREMAGDAFEDERAKSQAFFANLRESVRPGYVGDQHKTFVAQLLIQAQAAGLFNPEQP